MKSALTLILIFISLSGLSQSKERLKTSLDLVMMTKTLNNADFSKDLKTFSSFKLTQPLNYSGIAFTSGFMVNRKFKTDGYFEFLKIIPQQIRLFDSIPGKINGYQFGMTVFGFDLLKNEKIDLISSFGFNTGRIWINGNEEIKQKNPYFAPMISIVPRVCIGKISLQLKCSYDFDVSNKNWKRKGLGDSEQLVLNKFAYQGLNLYFGLGYVIE